MMNTIKTQKVEKYTCFNQTIWSMCIFSGKPFSSNKQLTYKQMMRGIEINLKSTYLAVGEEAHERKYMQDTQM